MYAVIRKFNRMRSVDEAGRRAESGLVPILRQSPEFRGYYVVKGDDGTAVSIALFETQEAMQKANRRAMAWIKDNLSDLAKDEPEVIAGEVVVDIPFHSAMSA